MVKENWRIVGRIETCMGAAKHWTGILPRTLRALATDIESLPSGEDFGMYKPDIDRIIVFVRHEMRNRKGKDVPEDSDDGDEADVLRMLADYIENT